MTAPDDASSISLWLDGLGPIRQRPPLDGDVDVDVAIVGAGFTGLWTAYYLRRAAPGLRIMVLDSRFAGFGASGRNGGWCSALFPASWDKIARAHGRGAALAMKSAMRESISEVESFTVEHGVDCGFTRGGTIGLARSAVQLRRATAEVEHGRSWGDTEDDLRLLAPDEVSEKVQATNVHGATFTPHCAAIDPGRLVRGLAEVVAASGVWIHEGTPVTEIRPARSGHPACRVVTPYGTVKAKVVVRATEGYTPTITGSHRDLAPVYSLIVATEPLPPAVLEQIGLAGRPTFTDHRHLISYGQRTADGRIVFGGRGAPYHFGSAVRPEFDREPAVFDSLRRTVVDLFPALDGAAFTHSWGGPLGVPRDWHAGVGLDPATGFAWAGGYVGDGVSTANLAGRTLADLITERVTPLTKLPWVGHRSRTWEPEPLRYLGINAGLRVMAGADRTEARTGRPSRMASAFSRLLGQ